jgi:hypothetical protein
MSDSSTTAHLTLFNHIADADKMVETIASAIVVIVFT